MPRDLLAQHRLFIIVAGPRLVPDGFKTSRPQIACSIINAFRRELFFDPSFGSHRSYAVKIARPRTVGGARQQMKRGIDLLSVSDAQGGGDRLAHLLRNA